MKKPKLSKKAFKDWLEGHEPNDVVGYSRCGGTCPVASFLHEGIEEEPYFIQPTRITWWPPRGEQGDSWPLPKWAQEFISEVDHSGELDYVKAKDALAIL